MSLEILENKIRCAKFVVGDEITNGKYTLNIQAIVPCDFDEGVHGKYQICSGCTIKLAYISSFSGLQYCSQNRWRHSHVFNMNYRRHI